MPQGYCRRAMRPLPRRPGGWWTWSRIYAVLRQHARYLIVDEADRLLDQSYQDWAQIVLDDMHQNLEGSAKVTPDFRPFDATTRRPYNLNAPGAPHPWYRTRLSKFLFSATLGDDPQQLNAMKLSRPLFLYSAVVDGQEVVKHLDGLSAERFFKDEKPTTTPLPACLTESAVSCDAASKPVALFALLERDAGVPADHRLLHPSAR